MADLKPDLLTGRPRSEILAFTGLRGVAAWVVVLYHFRNEIPSIRFPGEIVQNGEYFVDVFFVMSGYVLALSYGSLFTAKLSWTVYLRFVGYRLSRIYAAHLSVLFGYLAIPLAYLITQHPAPSGRFSPFYFVLSLFLVQNWGFTYDLDWNAPAWSISTEFLFYLGFPTIIGIMSTAQSAMRLMACSLALSTLLLALGLSSGQLGQDISTVGPARCLLECSLGIWLFQVARKYQITHLQGLLLLAVALAMIALFASGAAPDSLVIPPATVCFLWALLAPGNPVGWILSLCPFVWLGRISFSTYIVHYLVKDSVKLVAVGNVPDAAALLLYVTLVLVSSIVLYHQVEMPGQRIGRRLTDRLIQDPKRYQPCRMTP